MLAIEDPQKELTSTPIWPGYAMQRKLFISLERMPDFFGDNVTAMGKSSEEDIQNAIQSVKSGVSVTKSATRWGVPRSTLRHRLTGTVTHAAAAESQQRLSKRLEQQLGGWIATMTAIAEAPTHKQVREVATQLLVLEGDLRPLGKNWVVTFLRRNPHITAVKDPPGPAVERGAGESIGPRQL
ncbi:hypothetical protein MY5147_006299 [Beauveria neobassiana]|uniref:HTH CENPB-type domain-containing protein n=2 Tax=Beauveria bassiana TaxID=176275 RepID=A0A0A2VKP0_BEABA|nr:hypothetical protein BBAD15_g8001 [Beauveria bassiana D1-5]